MSITLESIVPVQADRDELLQLLNLLNTHWHQNEEAFPIVRWPNGRSGAQTRAFALHCSKTLRGTWDRR